jgi:hypothetical protein
VSKPPPFAVAVCAVASWFVQVTRVPTVTISDFDAKS